MCLVHQVDVTRQQKDQAKYQDVIPDSFGVIFKHFVDFCIAEDLPLHAFT